jgi:hypothetical protein
MAIINISKKRIVEKDGMVIMPVEEYNRLFMASIPTYQLTGKAAKALDKEHDRAWANYRAGKTRKIKSLADLD